MRSGIVGFCLSVLCETHLVPNDDDDDDDGHHHLPQTSDDTGRGGKVTEGASSEATPARGTTVCTASSSSSTSSSTLQSTPLPPPHDHQRRRRATDQPRSTFSSRELIKIFRDTRRVAAGRDGVARMKQGVEVYASMPDEEAPRGRYDTRILVVNKDTLTAAKEDVLDRGGDRPYVLSMANASYPGGGVTYGAIAQEEELMRCTDYSFALFPGDNPTLAARLGSAGYGIPELGCIFVPGVTVLRACSASGYAFIAQPFQVDIVASAAYNLKPRHPGGPKGHLDARGVPSAAACDYETGTRAKIRTQLAVAAARGHCDLVLGAFGCGAFANDPHKVAAMYKDLIAGEFRGVFRTITFAVLSASDAPSSNFRVFAETFANASSRPSTHVYV
jgi:uncharacterized protein (TIGR02452 family)